MELYNEYPHVPIAQLNSYQLMANLISYPTSL